MDFRQLLSDDALRDEFLDRIDEIAASPETEGGLEGLEGGVDPSAIEAAAESMAEGRWDSPDPGLEAIIRRFTRPVYLIQRGTFLPPQDSFPDSHQIAAYLETARSRLNQIIPSIGRIDLRNHRLDWIGTGWVVAPRTVVTNRHVAQAFARASGPGFAFLENDAGRRVAAYLDWRQEYQEPDESRFRVEDILWIEPDGSVDVALLLIAARGEDGAEPPDPIGLMTDQEIRHLGLGSWIGVIGYPAYSSFYNREDQQRIFDGIYGCKRIAPGQVTALVEDTRLYHDATTLTGSSGSAVVDLASGKAIGLHFEGVAGDHNTAVLAPQVAHVLSMRTQ
jgi:Trypsin-like peptidase domain